VEKNFPWEIWVKFNMLLNKNNFVLPEIPKLNPLGNDYLKFYKEEKRRCMEGYWSCGAWCPGNLYFYLNFFHMNVNKKVTDKFKVVARPFFREVEWEKAYYLAEARGFSGFADDEEETCHRDLKDFREGIPIPTSCYNKKGELKKYVEARDYLRKIHKKSLGKPLYENEAKNIIDLEARESGKSYWAASCILHNFLFDGCTDYDIYLEEKKNGTPVKSETLVGSIDSKYSSDLLSKVKLGLKYLPGEVEIGKVRYPSPFHKEFTGSLAVNSYIISDFKMGGGRKNGGSGSTIHHRTFSDNPIAGNGTRPNLAFLEEVGFHTNLLESLGSLRDCTTVSGIKFGTIYMMGTGGENNAEAIEPIKSVFYDPETYDCVTMDDIWENKGKIGIFIPPYKADNEFLDHQTGKIDEEKALQKYLTRREKLKKAKDQEPLNKELQSKPLVPSEIFLIQTGNKFPIADLQEQLKYVQTSEDPLIKGIAGELVLEGARVSFRPDLNNDLKICNHPLKSTDRKEGAVVIWEPPVENADYGFYVGGNDPYDIDDAHTSVSLGSTIILRRAGLGCPYDKIVAEYTGRPERAEQFYEITRRLLVYYKATCLYENEKTGIRTYLKNNHSLHLLALTPTKFKSNIGSVTANSRTYGQHMNGKVKLDGEIELRDWLNKPAGDGKKTLHYIYSEPILKELIGYNLDGNFDRVIALMLAVIQSNEMYHVEVKERQDTIIDDFFQKRLYVR
jgi:hypothetical protein